MSATILPFQPGATDFFSTPLLGTTYVFDVHWNDRDAAYYVSISDIDQNPIVSGIKIALGVFLGRTSYMTEPFKSGIFLAYDTTGQDIECGFDDLGGRVLIKYIPVQDWLNRIVAATEP